ncbi:MAG: rod shape-determining protein [Candidatus Pacebacteria bacterium]|jgi:rod shape-determining protein MreB|nr:rod shape-determining protein [Candidatus Paceibacterota bacterium]
MFLKIGIDLGTANSNVYLPEKGVVISEPTVVAYDEKSRKIIAVGREAKEMIGKTPREIKIYRPLKEGVIADYQATLAILKYFLNKIKITKFFKPTLVISVPAGISSTEKKAIIDAGLEAGAREVYPIKEPLLAALGAEMPIQTPSGNMIVNIGGGTTEIAVISLGGIVTFESLKIAGDKMDEAIREYLKRKFNLAIGERTAEQIKIQIGSALPLKNHKNQEDLKMTVNGIDYLTGLPKSIEITSSHVAEALQKELKEIVNGIKRVLANTPPELVADIMEKGIVLSGGGALLRKIDELISSQTSIKTFIAENPLFAVARGTGKVLEKIDIYKRLTS